MRCGSTLLLHLLLTHRQIIGCGERTSAYRSVDDVDRLAFAARLSQGALFRRCRYVVDQIAHDQFTPNEALLRHPRVRCVFLVREPPEAISSIVNLTSTFYEGWTVEKATNYYIQRLNTLARQAAAMPGRGAALALTFRGLVEDTASILRRLQNFLALEAGFSEQYAIQKFTGSRGDPSENIRAGRIVRGRVTALVEIPAHELDRAWQAHASCQQILRRL